MGAVNITISHGVGATMVPSGLLCKGPQQSSQLLLAPWRRRHAARLPSCPLRRSCCCTTQAGDTTPPPWQLHACLYPGLSAYTCAPDPDSQLLHECLCIAHQCHYCHGHACTLDTGITATADVPALLSFIVVLRTPVFHTLVTPP